MENKQRKSQWIWYPGDFEAFLSLRLHAKRYERGMQITPIWRMDAPNPNVKFRKTFTVAKQERLQIITDGEAAVEHSASGGYVYRYREEGVCLEPGEHTLVVTVYQPSTLPALYVEGEAVVTDGTWEVSCVDGRWLPADCWNFTDPQSPPSGFHLAIKPLEPEKTEPVEDGVLYDFGRNLMAYWQAREVVGAGKLFVSYGESREEALDYENSYLYEELEVAGEFITKRNNAFRYLYLRGEGVTVGKVTALYEYLPLENRGAFSCDDPLLEEIYRVSLYTLHLNSREFFLDGIKRDRWVWGGDACQSYLLNYYSFFDTALCRRTIRCLRGKDPVTQHHNTIQDYTCFWFLSLWDYYRYTGDGEFLRALYPQAVTLMDFCLERTDERGFMNARPEDWVFVDWADLDNRGDVSFVQLLFARALETMALLAGLAGEEKQQEFYRVLGEKTKENCFRVFWSEEKGCFTHGPAKAENAKVTKHPNMFALSFGYLTEKQKKTVIKNALLNPDVPQITTPYMRFYELCALCEAGHQEEVTEFLRDYWGGMLRLGATTFWEDYKPQEEGVQHYAMYGKPYGKSLCHAWGAGPILLYGKYYLGVRPADFGYRKFLVSPCLGGLQRVSGKVPTPDGEIFVSCDGSVVEVKNQTPFSGILVIGGQEKEIAPHSQLRLSYKPERYGGNFPE